MFYKNKQKKIAVKCDSDWLCAEISAISDDHCILSCKLMFKVVLLLKKSVDWRVAYSTLNYSRNGIKAKWVGLSRCSWILFQTIYISGKF